MEGKLTVKTARVHLDMWAMSDMVDERQAKELRKNKVYLKNPPQLPGQVRWSITENNKV